MEWSNIPLRDRAKIISIGVKNGLRDLKSIKSEWKKFSEGGKLNRDSVAFSNFNKTLPKNLQSSSEDYDMYRYWELNDKPKNMQEAMGRESPMFHYNEYDKSYHSNSISPNRSTGNLEFMKKSNHPTLRLETDWYKYGISTDDNSVRTLNPSDRNREYIRKNYRLIEDPDRPGYLMYKAVSNYPAFAIPPESPYLPADAFKNLLYSEGGKLNKDSTTKKRSEKKSIFDYMSINPTGTEGTGIVTPFSEGENRKREMELAKETAKNLAITYAAFIGGEKIPLALPLVSKIGSTVRYVERFPNLLNVLRGVQAASDGVNIISDIKNHSFDYKNVLDILPLPFLKNKRNTIIGNAIVDQALFDYSSDSHASGGSLKNSIYYRHNK